MSEHPGKESDVSLNASQIQRYPAETAHVLAQMEPAEAVAALLPLEPPVYGPLFDFLPAATAQALFDSLPDKHAVLVLDMLHPRRAAELVGAQAPDRRQYLLAQVDGELHDHIDLLLRFPPDSAGSLMDPRILRLHEAMTAEQALARLREQRTSLRPVRARRILYIVDDRDRPSGMVEIQDLALAAPGEVLSRFMQPVPAWADALEDKEQVVEKLEEHQISSLPVLGSSGELLGLVRYEMLVAVAREDAVADIQSLFGVDREERALSPVRLSISQRLPWLQINLLTAFMAAAVVGLFEETIAQFTALAVLLPVVAGQSGNTGAQALAVVIRSLALREVRVSQWKRVLRKELGVGLANGLAVAVSAGLAVFVWSRSADLTLIIFLAMVLSVLMAGLAGAAIPLVLSRLGHDPAHSSSIILTTVTDIAGFFSFLGIATLLLGL